MQTKAPGCVDGWHAVLGAEDEVIMQTEIGRCHNISSLNLAQILWHPCGVRGSFLPRSGGVAAVIPRLMAWNPPGSGIKSPPGIRDLLVTDGNWGKAGAGTLAMNFS